MEAVYREYLFVYTLVFLSYVCLRLFRWFISFTFALSEFTLRSTRIVSFPSFLSSFLPFLSLYLFFSFLLTFFLVYNRVATQTEPQSSQRTNLVQPSQSYQTNFHYRVLPILIHLYEGTTICAWVYEYVSMCVSETRHVRKRCK